MTRDLDHALARALLATFRPRMDVFARRFDTREDADRVNAWMRAKGYLRDDAARFVVGDYKPAGPRGARTPLTLDAVVEHVRGRCTLGFYPLHPDGTANSISLDLDDHRGATTVERDPREDLDALVNVCLRRGVRFLANHSRGGRGYWLHIFPTPGTPARIGRAILLALVREAGLRHITDGGTFDALCPKQSDLKSAGAETPGNLFCVPLCGRWLGAEPPGTHFLHTNPADLAAQLRTLTEY